MFFLRLPAERSALHRFGNFVHDNDHDHQDDDADEHIGGSENARRHADEKANAFGGGDEFTDDGADHRERNARANAGEDIGRNRRKDHFERQLPALDSHQTRQVDVFVIHLAHAGIGIKKIEKERKEKYHADFRPEPDAQPDDEKRRQRGARNAVERDDDRFENFGEQAAAAETVAEGDAGNRADRKADRDF